MTKAELLEFYSKRKNDYADSLAKAKERINLVSNVRLASAFFVAVFIYISITYTFFIIPVILMIGVFIFLVQYHARLFENKMHLQNLVTINDNEINLLSGNAAALPTGREFIDPYHPYTHDLDIFGEGSLYQFINRCNTLRGKKLFAERLSFFYKDPAKIIATQQAIQELQSKTEFRQQLQAAGMEIEEQVTDRAQLETWLHQPSFLFNKKIYRVVLIALPVSTIAAIIAAFFFPGIKGIAILLALSQWVILGLNIKRVNAFHENISRKKNILFRYAQLLKVLHAEQFTSALLKSFSKEADEADIRVKRLASLVSGLDARLNSMTNLVVNSLLMYDLQYVCRLEQWKEENATKLLEWLDDISETEVVSSFGTFAFNNAAFTYAKILEDLMVEAKDLGHPLINAQERVTNSVTIGGQQSVLIITGANMAGKSTFLRTIGINVVLALNGAPVCASYFAAGIFDLRSGMRTADSLKDHQSYFHAELNRLKNIMDDLRSDKPLLILLDEILKGTNSTDKQAGSIALVKQLLPHPCLALIATHDLVLGELEHEFPQQIKNFCFEPTIENDQLNFDYKLKAGLAQKMNATFLMKKMGIIPQ